MLARPALATIAALAVLAVTQAAAAARPPGAVLAAASKAVDGQQSVHYEVRQSLPGGTRIAMSGDAGVNQGIQRITFSKGGRTGHVTVLVRARTAYIRGDAFILENYMLYNSAQAKLYAGVWIRIPHGDGAYSTVAAGVSMASTAAELESLLNPRPPVTLLPVATVEGVQALGLQAKTTTTKQGTEVDTVYVRATGLPLLVKVNAALLNGSYSITFSRWNEAVQVQTPVKAVPSSRVDEVTVGPPTVI